MSFIWHSSVVHAGTAARLPPDYENTGVLKEGHRVRCLQPAASVLISPGTDIPAPPPLIHE